MVLNPYLVSMGSCVHTGGEEVGVGMFKSRDDIHILPMFWFQTVRESKKADEVC